MYCIMNAHRCIFLSDWVEYLILVHVSRVLVVVPVGHLPRVVGDQDAGVKQVAHEVVEQGAAREGAVAAVVAEHEDGPEHGALQKGSFTLRDETM